MQYRKLWIALGVVMLVSFTVLGSRRLQSDQQRAAHSEQGRHDRRTRAVHRRNHSQRAKRLAVNRRPGDRDDLGPRRLRCSRLERRLSSSAVSHRSRSLGAGSRVCQLCAHCLPNSAPLCRVGSPKSLGTIPTIRQPTPSCSTTIVPPPSTNSRPTTPTSMATGATRTRFQRAR